jgi:hypothetical protein
LEFVSSILSSSVTVQSKYWGSVVISSTSVTSVNGISPQLFKREIEIKWKQTIEITLTRCNFPFDARVVITRWLEKR